MWTCYGAYSSSSRQRFQKLPAGQTSHKTQTNALILTLKHIQPLHWQTLQLQMQNNAAHVSDVACLWSDWGAPKSALRAAVTTSVSVRCVCLPGWTLLLTSLKFSQCSTFHLTKPSPSNVHTHCWICKLSSTMDPTWCVRELLNLMDSNNQTHLKHKHVPPSWYWADQDRIEDLVILFTLCWADVDDLPFKV